MTRFGRSSEASPTITLTRGWFFAMMYFVTLVAQIVVVYSIANAARAQGVAVSPVQAVTTFLSTLLLFGVMAVSGLVLLGLGIRVLRIPVPAGLSKRLRLLFRIVRLVFVLALVVSVPFLTRDVWMKSEYLAMLPLPLFFCVLGLIMSRSTRRPRVVSVESSDPIEVTKSRTTSSRAWHPSMDEDTIAVPIEPAMH